MASRKRKYTETATSEEHKKAQVCVVHSQGSAGRSFVYFSGCQRPEDRLEKLQNICKWGPIKPADSPNRKEDSHSQMPEKLKPEHGWYRNCYRRFTKNIDCLKSSREDSETIQQSRTSWRSSTAFEKMILKTDCIFCNKEFVWMSRLEDSAWICRKLKGREALTEDPRFWLFCMWSKFLQQLSQAVSENPNSLVKCKWRKQERAGGPRRVTSDSRHESLWCD